MSAYPTPTGQAPLVKREPVVIVMSILAGLQTITAGTALADVIGKDLAGLLVLAVAAVQTGVQFYVRGQVTPTINVAAEQPADPQAPAQAGPASELPTGTDVDVVPAAEATSDTKADAAHYDPRHLDDGDDQ